MGNGNSLSNLNSFFKEMYSDSLEDLLSNFHWDKKKSKLYYDEVSMVGLSVMLGITPPKPKILILELTNG